MIVWGGQAMDAAGMVAGYFDTGAIYDDPSLLP
jgi:hypothetical protein